MKYELMSVYDTKARAFLTPWFSQNLQVAARSFSEVVNNPVHIIFRNAEDFNLYHLGSWDDNTAQVEMHKQPVNLGSAVNFKTE